MRIVSCRKAEDCFDGSQVMTYTFDAPWQANDVIALKVCGTVQYYPDFPRPFFRLYSPSGLQAMGVVGSSSCRSILPARDTLRAKEEFEKHFEGDKSSNVDSETTNVAKESDWR